MNHNHEQNGTCIFEVTNSYLAAFKAPSLGGNSGLVP